MMVDSLAVVSRAGIFSAFFTNGVSDLLVHMGEKKISYYNWLLRAWQPYRRPWLTLQSQELFSAGAVREKEKGNSYSPPLI